MRRRLVAALTLPVLVAACATSPTGRSQLMLVSDAQMTTLGHQAFADIRRQKPIETDPRVNRYVRCIADAIVRAAPGPARDAAWDVIVFRDDTPNAFALPGGGIGVHTGLLAVARTPDQLAAVIGHEVGHVLARHSHERVSQALAANAGLTIAGSLAGDLSAGQQRVLLNALGLGAQVGVLLPFSRAHESEADVIGLDLMARAGFDPREAVVLWENMRRAGGRGGIEFLSTHPTPDTRIRALWAEMPRAMDTYDDARRAGRRPRCPPTVSAHGPTAARPGKEPPGRTVE